jgi:outer membrane protein assembly factor BamB
MIVSTLLVGVLVAADWPSARGPQHNGAAPDAPAPPLKRLWRVQVAPHLGPAAIVGDAVVVGSRTHLVRLDLATGRERWRTATGPDPVEVCPLIAGGTVVAGDEGGSVRAWNLADGSLRWTADVEAKVLGGAVHCGEVALVGSYSHKLYALALADGAVRWALETGGPVHAGPGLAGDVAVVGGCDGAVHLVDAATGSERAAVPGGANIGATPAAGDGAVLAAVLDGQWLYVATDDGAVRWQGSAEGERYEQATAIAGDLGILVSQEGVVRALRLADGSEAWKQTLGNGVDAAPAIGAGQVWIADAAGMLHALALADGSETWRLNIGSPLAAPAISQGRLVVGTRDGWLWCLGAAR